MIALAMACPPDALSMVTIALAETCRPDALSMVTIALAETCRPDALSMVTIALAETCRPDALSMVTIALAETCRPDALSMVTIALAETCRPDALVNQKRSLNRNVPIIQSLQAKQCPADRPRTWGSRPIDGDLRGASSAPKPRNAPAHRPQSVLFLSRLGVIAERYFT
jgi:hypothetical protein